MGIPPKLIWIPYVAAMGISLYINGGYIIG